MRSRRQLTEQQPRRCAYLFTGFAMAAAALVFQTQIAAAVPAKLKRECRADYKSFCPQYKAGTAKMRACMRSNGRQLSWDCYQSLKDHGYVKGR